MQHSQQAGPARPAGKLPSNHSRENMAFNIHEVIDMGGGHRPDPLQINLKITLKKVGTGCPLKG